MGNLALDLEDCFINKTLIIVSAMLCIRLKNTPERHHKVKGRNRFAFSDLRHIIAKVALSDDFNAVCCKEQQLPRKSFMNALLRMVG